MSSEADWHNVVRIAWTSGGMVAVSNPGPEVEIVAGMGGKVIGTLKIPSSASLFPTLQQMGLTLVGVSFIQLADEASGLLRPQFRAFSKTKRWLVEDMHQKWRQIAHASAKQNEMSLMDVASRIASALVYSEMRVLDLAEAYSAQLRGYLHINPAIEYQRFKDTHSSTVYKDIHALFWEMAILRDSLAEFAAIYCFALPGVTTFSSLIKELKKSANHDELAKQILDAGNEKTNGWIAVFSTYRNLFTHSSPMEQAAGVAFAVQDMLKIPVEQQIPQIYYPLPFNVIELKKRRSGGPLFQTFKELTEAASGRRHERTTEPDALDYLSDCLDHFAQLSLVLSTRSPIEAMPLQITHEDLIGEVEVTGGQCSS